MGEKYIENFFKYSIGHFLSQQNISYIKEKKLQLNVIFKESEKNIVEKFINKNHISFINQIFVPDYKFKKNKYESHSYLVSEFIKKVSSEKYIHLMYPDQIISNNFFEVLFKNNDNFDLYFMPGIRTVIKNENINFLEKINITGIDTKSLTNFIYNNLHIKIKLMTLNNKYYNNAPAWLIYNDPKGLVLKSFHLTPILIKNNLIKNNIDKEFIGIDDFISSIYLTDKIKFFNNSKEICWCSYETERIEDFNIFKNTKDFETTNDWIDKCVTDYQKFLYKKYIFYLTYNDENLESLKKIKTPFIIFKLMYFFKKPLKVFNKIKKKIINLYKKN